MLGGDHASQTGVSIGLEKYFRGSGHSLALEIGHHRKQGPYDRPEFGGRRERTSANLVWRYDLSNAMRPLQPYRIVENGAPAPAMPQVVRNQVQIASQELFEFDRSELTPAAQTQLLGLLEALTVRRVGTVEVAGHTCDLGSDAYNQDLSERRAATVGDWLRAHGVPADAIVARGLGESQPPSERFGSQSCAQPAHRTGFHHIRRNHERSAPAVVKLETRNHIGAGGVDRARIE